ncbi:MAG TPA: hypothetical protein VGN37_02380 [Actinocatenispora sp.]
MSTTAPRPVATAGIDLNGRIRDVEAAIGAPVGADWRGRAAAAVAALRSAFLVHVDDTEGPDGRYADLVTAAPRLAGAVGRLVREHPRIGGELSDLARVLTDPATARPPVGAAVVLRRLVRHQERGADLLYEAYVIDLGGET